MGENTVKPIYFCELFIFAISTKLINSLKMNLRANPHEDILNMFLA